MDIEKRKRKYLMSKRKIWSKVVLSIIGLEASRETWNEQLKTWETRSELYWEIDDIIDERIGEDGKQYVLIQWKNWPSSYNSWEPVENLNADLPVVLKSVRKRKKKSKKEYSAKSKDCKRGLCRDLAQDLFDGTHRDNDDGRLQDSTPESSTNEQKSLMALEVSPTTVALVTEGTASSLLDASSPQAFCENSNKKTLILNESQRNSPNKQAQPRQSIDVKLTITSNVISDTTNSQDENYCDELEIRKVHMLKELSNIDQILLEQEAQISKQRLVTEMIIEMRKEHPGNLLQGSPYNPIELYDRLTCNYKIDNHTSEENGTLSAFRVTAYNKFDTSEDPVVFWTTVSDATQKYQGEVIDYLIQINKKPDSLSQTTGFNQSL